MQSSYLIRELIRELFTNRPLYFVRDTYELTYYDDRLPTHYGFQLGSKLDRIEADYRKLAENPPTKPASPHKRGRPNRSAALTAEARRVIDALDERGAWVETGRLKEQNQESKAGVIHSQTFVANLRTLSRYLAAR